jgi:preprotein translocase, secE subunit
LKGEGKMAEKTENAKKPEKSKFNLAEIFKVHMAEFKRIIWPSREEVIKQTITVIVISLIIGLIIWGLDIGYENLYQAAVTALGK